MNPYEIPLHKIAAAEEEVKDEDAKKKVDYANRRLHLKAVLNALKLGAIGAFGGGIASAAVDTDGHDMHPALGASIGGLLGAGLGYGGGYAAGKARRHFGLDPMLDTMATSPVNTDS